MATDDSRKQQILRQLQLERQKRKALLLNDQQNEKYALPVQSQKYDNRDL